MTIEDNFLEYLTFDDNLEEITMTKQSKDQKDAGFSRRKSIGTKEIKDYLIGIPEIEAVVSLLQILFTV